MKDVYSNSKNTRNQNNSKVFYSCEELAGLLNVNIMTIYRYIDKGKLEAYKIGRHYRISNNEFNNFLEEIKTNNK